ncbi:MAG: Energy-coupling factor transporter ATP-binding protein EcfA2 [Pelotomaculum sp. PtaB.Bin104]|nr:MAG: Energy-coupling factor transporter ATP-binding protein EcfA2 [Pelotomaculum sp. PtaB.Bin104]
MFEGSIELVNVTKEFNVGQPLSKIALNDVSLTVRQGEFVGLLGMNGSGKSTLARLVNGLIKPTAGKVYVNGLDTAASRSLIEIRRQVGMVFQNPDNQIISSIVEEDIAFGPENLGLSRAEISERVEWSLQAVGLTELRQHAPHMLSGGQKQKVAIACALAMRPSHLVLDEPTSMLDPRGRRELGEILTALNQEYNITVILISHNMEDVVGADRIVVLHQGGIYMTGTPAEVFTASEQLAAAGLRPPEIVQLAENLRRSGFQIDRNIITVPKMVEYLCQS